VGISAAYGMPFFGWEPAKPVPVIYIDGEMIATDMQSRLKELSTWVLETIEHTWEPFFVITPDAQPYRIRKIDTPEGRGAIIDAVMSARARLVFLDNLSCLTNPEDDNASSSWSAVQDLLLELRRVGISVVIGHHSGKNGEQRGTSRRADILDLVLKLSPVADAPGDGRTRVQIEFEKGRHLRAEEKEPFIATLEPHPKGGLVWSRSAPAMPVIDQVRQMLADGMTPGEIATEAKVNRSYCYRIKNQMLTTGELSPPIRGPQRDVSPVSFLEKETRRQHARLRGQDSETNRRQSETTGDRSD
jgi:hypothetical protein